MKRFSLKSGFIKKGKVESLFFFISGIIFLTLFFRNLNIQKSAAAGNFPHVIGNRVVDGNGQPLILRGVQIPSEFNLGWKGGGTINTALGPKVMAAIHSWGANTLRLPVGAYEYQQNGYMASLDSVVQNANQNGFYVIFANFEDGQAMGGNSVLDQQGLTFWKFLAQHYANNPMVLYDLINEPKNNSYAEWLNGGGSVVGMQQIVDAIRSSGGKQIVVAEAIDVGTTFFKGFSSFINDPNIIYSLHIYFKDTTERSQSGWDSEFGALSANYPVLVGEWALLPNARYPSFCQGLDATSGTTLLNNFLTYMNQHSVNWTAWAFNPSHLIKDQTTFTPTVLTDPWCCGQGPVCSAGMGQVIKNFLLNQGNPTPSNSPAPSNTPSASNTPTTSPVPNGTNLSITIGLHGLGLGGDNTNPHGQGTMNPSHQTRTISVSVFDLQNNPVSSSPFSGQINYDAASGLFKTNSPVSLGLLPTGDYQIKLLSDGFLVKLVSTVHIIQGQTNQLPQISLTNGDIDNDNSLTAKDYGALVDCFGSKQSLPSCSHPPTQQSAGADIDDDGTIGGPDYNLFLRELSTQNGG